MMRGTVPKGVGSETDHIASLNAQPPQPPIPRDLGVNHGRQKGEILETSLRSHSWKAVEERCPKHRFAIGTIMGSWVPAKKLLGMLLIFGDGASAKKSRV
jgi:hypothetical protein